MAPAMISGAKNLALQIERYILHELYELDRAAREGFSSYQFNKGAHVLPDLPGTLLTRRLHSLPSALDLLEHDPFVLLLRRDERRPLRLVDLVSRAAPDPLGPAHRPRDVPLGSCAHGSAVGRGDLPLLEGREGGSEGGRRRRRIGLCARLARARTSCPPALSAARGRYSRARDLQNPAWHAPELKRDMDELLAVRAEVNGLLEQARNDKCASYTNECYATLC